MEPFTLFLIYIFYGAAFFAMGVAIVARLKTFATLQIAGFFWLLALFGFSHAGHEWLELFLAMEVGTEALRLQVRQVSLLLLLISFVFLLLFGINLHRVLNPRAGLYLIGIFLLLTAGFLLVLYNQLVILQQPVLEVIDYRIRKLFALPATLFTASGFILYARRLQTMSSKGAGNFIGAGAAFVAYGVFTGVLSSQTVIAQLPIQFWRGLSAFIILHFIMYALDRFLGERDALISQRLEQTAQSEKLSSIGRLAAGVAHEINNPLTNVSLQLEMLEQDQAVKSLPAKTRNRLDIARRNLDRSTRIAKELLIFAGKPSEQLLPQPVDLVPIISRAWHTLDHRNANHELVQQLPASLMIPGYSFKLEQLFTNLFQNALDASPAGGIITVSGREEQDRVVITVSDQGEGIAPENLSLVMEPFFTTKKVGKGVGLGLAICYGIMLEHGGEISLLASPDSRGATVRLIFKRDLPGLRQKFEEGG